MLFRTSASRVSLGRLGVQNKPFNPPSSQFKLNTKGNYIVSHREISTTRVLNATIRYRHKPNINEGASLPSQDFYEKCETIAGQESFRHAVGYTKHHIRQGNIRPDVNTFNKLFSLAAENPKRTTTRSMQQLLNEMWFEHGVHPNEETFHIIIKHFNKHTDPLAIVFFSHMTKHWNLKPNRETIADLLETCVRTEHYRQADKIWKRLPRYQLTPTLEMFHTMLNMAWEEKDVDAAVTRVQEMHNTEDVDPTVDTFNILLKLHRDNVATDQEVTDVILAMQECGIRPNDETKEHIKEWISRRDAWEREEILERSKLDSTSLIANKDILEVVLDMGEAMSIQKREKLKEAEAYFSKLQHARVVNSQENRRSIWLTVASDFEHDYLPRDAHVAIETASMA